MHLDYRHDSSSRLLTQGRSNPETMGCMELTVKEVVEERPASTVDTVTLASSDIDALREQRIRWDGYFTGPTW